jgi:hypothetical protein
MLGALLQSENSDWVAFDPDSMLERKRLLNLYSIRSNQDEYANRSIVQALVGEIDLRLGTKIYATII